MTPEDSLPDADFIALGAYERDNFGDLLFWHATKTYAENQQVVAAAPFPGRVDEVLGVRVHRYIDLIQARRPLPVWVVGGEVGGTLLSQAFRAYRIESEGKAGENAVSVSGLRSFASPYMAFEGPHPIFLNSVGLDGLRTLRGRRLGYAALAVRSASFVSVRERASAEVLRRLNVRHNVAPDIVQTISMWHELSDTRAGYVVFQMKSALLAASDLRSTAGEILHSTRDGERVVLMAAGLAPGHDSARQYELLASELRKLSPMTEVSLHLDPDPTAKVDLIAQANLWIGTSLHGLIISTAYGVPSVSLLLRKLRLYANSWALPMPVGISLSNIRQASDAARSEDRVGRLHETAPRLAGLADANMRQGLEVLDAVTNAASKVGPKHKPGSAAAAMGAVSARARLLI